MKSRIGVGIVGFGTVGTGVAKILLNSAEKEIVPRSRILRLERKTIIQLTDSIAAKRTTVALPHVGVAALLPWGVRLAKAGRM